MPILDHLEPRAVFSCFEQLCAIPHGSGNTKAISDYLVRFAAEHQLRCIQDAHNNVIIFAPGTPGYESAAPVILQGHMDMVCETAPDSALFLWATFPQLPEALRLIEAWGFTYKSVAFVWLKKNKKADSWFYGLGFWTRGNAEICLLATKGHPKRQAANIHQFIISPIEAHSKKPDEARDKILSLMGDLPRVELFARQTPPGWAVWGNEVTPTIPDFGTHCPEVQKGV